MASSVLSAAVMGMDCIFVEVEVDISQGLPAFVIVGLGDVAVQEAKERVRSAIRNSGFSFPQMRKTVNLAPADVRKVGPAFDLPIAVAILKASEQFVLGDGLSWEEVMFVGELALNGETRGINGVLNMVFFAKERRIKRVYVPFENLEEALLVEGIEVVGVRNLKEVFEGRGDQYKLGEISVSYDKVFDFDQSKRAKNVEGDDSEEIEIGNNRNNIERKKKIFLGTESKGFNRFNSDEKIVDMSMVSGQQMAKRALMIAAAGRHNVLFTGPPGSGKTMLAKAFRGILGEMEFEEKLEVTKVFSVAGMLPKRRPLVERRPFRSVHHTASRVSLIGGGSRAKPGEISLAHKGVLFLDEIAEFPVSVLECLRQPLEDKKIVISRAAGSYTYPADFMLIAAMNPCPCGFYGDDSGRCACTIYQIRRYQSKISGPLLDRIDIFVELPRLGFEDLNGGNDSGDSGKGDSGMGVNGGRGNGASDDSDASDDGDGHSNGSGNCASDGGGLGGEVRDDLGKVVESVNKNSSAMMTKEIERVIKIQRRRGLINSEMDKKAIHKYCRLSGRPLETIKNAVKALRLSPRGYERVLKLARTIADFDESEDILEEHLCEALQYRRADFY